MKKITIFKLAGIALVAVWLLPMGYNKYQEAKTGDEVKKQAAAAAEAARLSQHPAASEASVSTVPAQPKPKIWVHQVDTEHVYQIPTAAGENVAVIPLASHAYAYDWYKDGVKVFYSDKDGTYHTTDGKPFTNAESTLASVRDPFSKWSGPVLQAGQDKSEVPFVCCIYHGSKPPADMYEVGVALYRKQHGG